jgi:predicted GH43/DUF377 family glycosyl hydrolase
LGFICAFLLDLNDPSWMMGGLPEPLLSPNESRREGYVPNAVYGCGVIVHDRESILRYAMSGYAGSFARVNLDELLSEWRTLPSPVSCVTEYRGG